MPKFFISPGAIRERFVSLGESNTPHLKALRLRTGEMLTVSDGNGWEYRCIYRGLDAGEGGRNLLAAMSVLQLQVPSL